jgi:hypothetical protein
MDSFEFTKAEDQAKFSLVRKSKLYELKIDDKFMREKSPVKDRATLTELLEDFVESMKEHKENETYNLTEEKANEITVDICYTQNSRKKWFTLVLFDEEYYITQRRKIAEEKLNQLESQIPAIQKEVDQKLKQLQIEMEEKNKQLLTQLEEKKKEGDEKLKQQDKQIETQLADSKRQLEEKLKQQELSIVADIDARLAYKRNEIDELSKKIDELKLTRAQFVQPVQQEIKSQLASADISNLASAKQFAYIDLATIKFNSIDVTDILKTFLLQVFGGNSSQPGGLSTMDACSRFLTKDPYNTFVTWLAYRSYTLGHHFGGCQNVANIKNFQMGAASGIIYFSVDNGTWYDYTEKSASASNMFVPTKEGLVFFGRIPQQSRPLSSRR